MHCTINFETHELHRGCLALLKGSLYPVLHFLEDLTLQFTNVTTASRNLNDEEHRQSAKEELEALLKSYFTPIRYIFLNNSFFPCYRVREFCRKNVLMTSLIGNYQNVPKS